MTAVSVRAPHLLVQASACTSGREDVDAVPKALALRLDDRRSPAERAVQLHVCTRRLAGATRHRLSESIADLPRDEFEIQISMSRKGNPYDNPISESFFMTLEGGEIYLWEVPTYEELEAQLPECIADVYSTEWLDSVFGCLLPAECEARLTGGLGGDVMRRAHNRPN